MLLPIAGEKRNFEKARLIEAILQGEFKGQQDCCRMLGEEYGEESRGDDESVSA